jgi:hypothetical protein
MTNAYNKLVHTIKEEKAKNMIVPAVRVGKQSYYDILKNTDKCYRRDVEGDEGFLFDEAEYIIAGTEIIVDESIEGIETADLTELYE